MNKIPCIKCTPELWEYIRPYLKEWGYKIGEHYHKYLNTFPYVVLNNCGEFGSCANYEVPNEIQFNRELVTNVEEFLERAAKLKGFTYKRKDMKEFTLNDLQPGMIVEYRNQERRLVVLINNVLHLISPDCFLTNIQSVYNNDLTYKYDKMLDIIKVYKITTVRGLKEMLNLCDSKLIWERKEIKEYTMQEIADKLGIPVEQLRIKK